MDSYQLVLKIQFSNDSFCQPSLSVWSVPLSLCLIVQLTASSVTSAHHQRIGFRVSHCLQPGQALIKTAAVALSEASFACKLWLDSSLSLWLSADDAHFVVAAFCFQFVRGFELVRPNWIILQLAIFLLLVTHWSSWLYTVVLIWFASDGDSVLIADAVSVRGIPPKLAPLGN